MSSYDDDPPPPPKRESIMEQRLRRASGEIDDEPFEDVGYSGRPARRYGGAGPSSSGCAQSILYLVIGGIVITLLLLFAGNSLIDRIGDAFMPDFANIAPTPTPVIVDRGVTVRQIQSLSRLETTRYSLEIVEPVKQDGTLFGVDPPDFLSGLVDDELLLVVRGNVVAGVDMAKLDADAVQISADGESITLTLPPSEIFDATLDEQRTQVYSRERGLFAPENKDLEVTARQRAQGRFLQSACEDGVMQKASEQAQESVERLLRLSGFAQVEVRSQAGECVLPGSGIAPVQPTTIP